MPIQHLTTEELRRFAANQATREERMNIVLHLLAGCDRCARMAAREFHLNPTKDFVNASSYPNFSAQRMFQREQEKLLAKASERMLGWSQWACLETLPVEERLIAVRSRKALQNRGLLDRLLEVSTWTRREVPREGAEVALLAVEVSRQEASMCVIDPENERLQLQARHNLAHAMATVGRVHQALGMLADARPLYRKFNDTEMRHCMRWVEARVLRSLGNMSAAVAIFNQLWEQFRALDLGQEVELVSIELAWTFAKQAGHDPGPQPIW